MFISLFFIYLLKAAFGGKPQSFFGVIFRDIPVSPTERTLHFSYARRGICGAAQMKNDGGICRNNAFFARKTSIFLFRHTPVSAYDFVLQNAAFFPFRFFKYGEQVIYFHGIRVFRHTHFSAYAPRVSMKNKPENRLKTALKIIPPAKRTD